MAKSMLGDFTPRKKHFEHPSKHNCSQPGARDPLHPRGLQIHL